ncbi:MAG: cytochrome P460 family protein [Betaproteobacteria bacterium]|nr:cytochrome P460 family protein [Betaproteobacteria bacterium]
MNLRPLLIALCCTTVPALAADAEAGRAKAASVCVACHGANGVSVAEHIPNLAGQRAGYLSGQLNAFKSGMRKNDIMSVIAGQLSPADIANVAAHFSALAAATGPKSAFLPTLAATRITVPADFKTGFTRYHVENSADSGQVKLYYANDKASSAAKAGKPLPDGSAIFIEVYAAKRGEDKQPLKGADGNLVAEKLLAYTAMAREAGWGGEVPEMIRNENWNYAVFGADRVQKTTINQAECLACHKPTEKSSYVFTLKDLAAARP